jgi:hypothetical protein
MTKRKIDYWVIPPEADGEFVASMEEVLETHAKPYDSRHPVICMDEAADPVAEGDASADSRHQGTSASRRLRI